MSGTGDNPDPEAVDKGSALPESIPTLDLTQDAEPVEPHKASVTSNAVEERREDTRRLIATWLLVGLAVISLCWLAVGVWGDAGDVAAGGGALDQIFTGILGLTGTAVGFYFGSGGASGHK